MYREDELIAVARRENNLKRNYLAVNRKQGKHVPVSPEEAFSLYRALADEIRHEYEGQRLLVIGFAETATAIGAALAVELNSLYMQTTREELDDVKYLFFSESHSHATEQKLVKDDLDRVMRVFRDAGSAVIGDIKRENVESENIRSENIGGGDAGRGEIESIDRILFTEDELTTGSTILSAIGAIERAYGDAGRKISFSAVSILNGMDEAALKRYEERNVGLHFLIKTDHERYSHLAERYRGDGSYHEAMLTEPRRRIQEWDIAGGLNARRMVRASEYQERCGILAEKVLEETDFRPGQRILVLGTEEFMYPALFFGRTLEEKGVLVKSHSTTRSPIVVSSEPEYPLHRRYQLVSLYDSRRTTFIYDLEKYDKVIVLTDARRMTEEGRRSLANALIHSGNEEICFVRWSEG